MVKRLFSLKDNLTRHLLAAERAGVRMPQFRIGPYVFALWVNLITKEPSILIYYYRRGGGQHAATISKRKLYPNGGFDKLRDLNPIRQIAEHPLHAAKAASFVTDKPMCACCRRRLMGSDARVGIGKACLEKWNWPR